MKIKLALLDCDKNYLSRLSAVFSDKYADKIEFYSFTEKQIALQSLRMGRTDVFLANERFVIDADEIPDKCSFAYIAENAQVESIREQRAIFKYQRADLFYKQILGLYAEKARTAAGFRFSDESKTQVISFASFSGGTGSSTTAAAFCVYAAKAGKKVLYLNLEQTGSAESFFSGEGQFDFSDILYALKSRKNNIALKLESTVKQDASGVYFYACAKVALDLMELAEEDLRMLLDELRISGGYDYIVMDMDLGLDQRSFRILAGCAKVVFVSDGTEIANLKFQRGYRALRLYEQQSGVSVVNQAYLFYNKFSNKVSKTVEGIEINELGGVPRFEHATTAQIVQQLVMLADFGKLLEKQE